MKIRHISLFLAALAAFSSCQGNSQLSNLEDNFNTPPAEARPRVWWHWMDGNVTKEGAMKDIEWMHRVGIGGFHCFDAGLGTPQIVENRIKYMSDEWKDVFSASIAKAEEYGMEVGVAASPGWSETGGPWVKPENAMKKIVWSETDAAGGRTFKGILPQPPVANGRFQDLNDETWKGDTWYRDIAVVAFKVNAPSMASLRPKLTFSGGDFTLEQLTNGRISDVSFLPGGPDGGGWIQYEFDEPQTIYGADIMCGISEHAPQRIMLQEEDGTVLECSNDGVEYKEVSLLRGKVFNLATLSFEPVTAKYFRLRTIDEKQAIARYFVRAEKKDMYGPEPSGRPMPVAEFNLYGTPRITRYVEKAGFFPAENLYVCPSAPSTAVSAASDVIDLSDRVSPDGTLEWDVPEGCWKIMRFGYSLTGHQNSPASAEATGLEVDKMDPDAVREYIEHYLEIYKDAAGGMMGDRGIRRIMLDSFESGCQNWTEAMPAEFKARCGYDLISWLPAIAGYVIESSENSDAFLWDFRKTIGDLIAENHYDNLAAILEEHGLESYMESQELVRAYVADGMRVKKNATIPMCAMWTADTTSWLAIGVSGADCRESASVAHLYGKKYVSAESLTTADPAWSSCPENLKARADLLLANGLNRFIIHESCHQPLDDFKPGFTLGPFGQWFNRHETWAEQAGVWTDYLARNCYMMQQGEFTADILYYYGEDNNLTMLYPYTLPKFPDGYNFDFVNADAVINDLTVKNGDIVSPSGSRYKLIALGDNAAKMSLPVLKSLSALVKAGAVLVGQKPEGTPSLSDDKDEFKAISDAMWADGRYGKGRVFTGTMEEALKELGCPRDISISSSDIEFKFVHRRLGDIQIYWVDNRTKLETDVEVSFNVTGLLPRIWDPADGSIKAASYRIADGRTEVKMHFDPEEALFVVFGEQAKENCMELPEPKVDSVPIEGKWALAFPGGMGAPEELTFDTLEDWTLNSNPYIRYYSGTGIYRKTFELSADQAGKDVILNLGSVKNIADVTVNGIKIGTAWKAPWTIDISAAVKCGTNSLEIAVTNLWGNRLIGDARGDAGKFAFSATQSRGAGEPLSPSGLLGPVSLELISF